MQLDPRPSAPDPRKSAPFRVPKGRGPFPCALAALLLALAPSSARAAWDFAPPTDAFRPNAALDLRSLNETVAGRSGFVKRTPDGADFALGNGRPVRFWAVDEYLQ